MSEFLPFDIKLEWLLKMVENLLGLFSNIKAYRLHDLQNLSFALFAKLISDLLGFKNLYLQQCKMIVTANWGNTCQFFSIFPPISSKFRECQDLCGLFCSILRIFQRIFQALILFNWCFCAAGRCKTWFYLYLFNIQFTFKFGAFFVNIRETNTYSVH